MIETKEIQLETSRGLATFHVSQINGVKAMKLFLRLANKFGPALSSLDKTKQSMRGAVGTILEKLDGDEFERVQNELLNECVCVLKDDSGAESSAERALPKLGELFAGHTFELGHLVVFALGVNYGNFFEKMGLKLDALRDLATP
jgi:hypothetical protein